jgi:hypothetical protein
MQTLRAPTTPQRANLSAVIAQLDRNDHDPLSLIMEAQAAASVAAEDEFAAFMDRCGDEGGYSLIDAPTLNALAITRLIESTTPEERLALLSPFDPLLRA